MVNIGNKTNSIAYYVAKKYEKQNLHWKVLDGKSYFNHNNNWISEDYISEYYPNIEYVKWIHKGFNPDSSSYT